VCIFDTEKGPMAMVLVGAMIVAAVETVWAGHIAPPRRELKVTEYGAPTQVSLEKGAEMGRFKLGSTVILCHPKDTVKWSENLKAGTPLRMGEAIAELV
jgi:phosphatidylserine decarboxylase